MSSQFLPFAAQTQVQPIHEAGQAFVIRCIPDPFTDERINVGVCVVLPDGKKLVRVIHEPGRLDCLYGEKAHMVVSMAKISQECLLANKPAPTDQIILDDPKPFYNMSAEDALNMIFTDQVTVALPRRITTKNVKIDDDAAIRMVIDKIKAIKGLDDDVIANTPHVLVKTESGIVRPIHIPLQPKVGVGTIRSGDYAYATLRTHLMDSLLDLECAGRTKNTGKMGIFILRPAHATVEQQRQTDNAIDDVYFRAPKSLHLGVREDGEALAHEINEWAETV